MYIVSSKMAFIAFTSVARTTALASAGSGTRRLSSAADGGGGKFSGKNAYQVLGVAEGSSFAEIKASFRRLAKETHPDVSASSDGPAASHQFLEILAAYEVKHMHWYQVGDKISVCECRCTRARLPPSRFWLFEPRCSMHDIGGWYIETFGRDKKGKTIPSQRQWDNMTEHHEKRLHPAMYLVALAYRTLDLEVAQKRKQIVKDIMAPKVYSMLHWCKKRF